MAIQTHCNEIVRDGFFWLKLLELIVCSIGSILLWTPYKSYWYIGRIICLGFDAYALIWAAFILQFVFSKNDRFLDICFLIVGCVLHMMIVIGSTMYYMEYGFLGGFGILALIAFILMLIDVILKFLMKRISVSVK